MLESILEALFTKSVALGRPTDYFTLQPKKSVNANNRKLQLKN